MKNLLIKYIIFCAFISTMSCSPPEDTVSSSTYCYGLLSSEVVSYSKKEMTLRVKFYVFDRGESDQLTRKNIENNLTFGSSDVEGILIDYNEVKTPYSGNYSCAVLLDEVYNIVNSDYWTGASSTDTFLRKFFKNAGQNNSFLLSAFGPEKPDVSFLSNGFKNSASDLDLSMARILNNTTEPTSKISKISLFRSIDVLMDTINKSTPRGNRNLLLLSTLRSNPDSKITIDSVLNKAARYGIKLSTIMDRTVENYFDYDLNNEDLFFKLANRTGGFVYDDDLGSDSKNNNILILASRLGNLMEGNLSCFESTWKILPADSWTAPFQPGFTGEAKLQIDLGTQYLSYGIEIPIRIFIK
jgi:hypothetical protein